MAPRAWAARPRADGADAKGWREEKGRDIYAGIWQGKSRTFYIPLLKKGKKPRNEIYVNNKAR